MSGPQLLYLFMVALYILVFALFLRCIFWKWYAERHYWRQRIPLDVDRLRKEAARQGRELPFFSIVVPALNEAEVIGQTIEHLAGLRYPACRYEIIIVTDEKELLARKNGGQAYGPSTQDVVTAKIEEFRRRGSAPTLKWADVPFDFDGRFNGCCLGREVPSTKGRALNYGLAFLDPRSEICAFYDADSRPESDVLLFIAHRWLESAGAVRIWQGPIFQVRNFFHLYPINKVAAIYQAVCHEWYLPVLMRRLPFVGGTNLFIESALLKEIGGYDPQSLVEDLELGVRAYVETGAWSEYFPYPSTEQTPATFRLYFPQRLRWATGHLQVTEKFRRVIYAEPDKIKKRNCMVRRLFVKGQLEWMLYQALILVGVAYPPLGFAGYLDPGILPPEARWLMSLGLPFYFFFTLTRFMHFRPYIDFTVAPRSVFSRALAVCHLLVLPLAAIALPLPFSTAVLLKSLHRQPTVWIKTPRTKEEMSRP